MTKRSQNRAILLLTFLACAHTAQASMWTFEPRNYYDPLPAGVREPQISALALAKATRMSFMVNTESPRRVWDIDLGTELPIAGWESAPSIRGRVTTGHTGFGLWIPVDFHMIEDFIDHSAPVVNTDYRFGIMAKLQHGLPNDQWIALRLFAGHESTHLGDEFSIVGKRTFPRSFERINVSWEYLDAGVMYERQGLSLRIGVTSTLPFGDSYYQTGPGTITESPLGAVTESHNSIDPYLGIEHELDTETPHPYVAYTSAELRYRSVYDYHKLSADQSEEREASINVIVGLRKSGDARGAGRASPYLRYYHGVNPHGQFRNQKNYSEFGIGIRLIQ